MQLPRTISTFWRWLTEPASGLTEPVDRRHARLNAGLFIMALLILIGVQGVRAVLNVAASPFANITTVINIIVIGVCYVLSRSRHYRTGMITGISGLMFAIYLQAIDYAYTNPLQLTDSTMWVVGLILVGALVVSWQLALLLAVIFVIGLAALPLFVAGLTIYDVRPSLEFVIGMTVLIIITAILRQRDLERINQQTAALTVSEARYRILLDAGFEGIVIHDNGRILDVNDAALAISGYTLSEIIGKMTLDLLTADARPIIAKMFAAGLPDQLVYETVVQHKNGQRIDAEIRSRNITYQGQQVRVIALRNITQSKQVSEQIKNLFDRLDRVFYSFSALDGHILQISPACEKLYGYPAQALYDDPSIWFRIIHPEDVTKFQEDLQQIIHDQHDMRPFRIIRKDGEVRWMGMQIVPVYNAANELTRFDGLVADITERQEAEAKERELQAERERSVVLRQFITDASHDLRTPLTTLNTSLYLLRRVSPPDEKISRYLSTLESQTAHLSRVLDDLFTMSRLDSPKDFVEKSRLDINQLMDSVINTQKPLAAQKQLQVHYFPAEAPVEVMTDKDYLLVALNHVVNNAVHYTPAEGSITIRICTLTPQEAQIEVADTGIGIQPSEIGSIFERFYRSDQARKTDTGGVGLGLSLARKIIEVHGGRIEAESTPGEGSIFRITLPLVLK